MYVYELEWMYVYVYEFKQSTTKLYNWWFGDVFVSKQLLLLFF